MTPLTFGNPLKFGPNFCHNTKGRPTFLHRERECSKPRTNHATHYYTRAHLSSISKGAFNGPRARKSITTAGGRMKARWRRWFFAPFSRPGIDRLATPLGIDESLAFRAFNKNIIFGRWLSETLKLALAYKTFLFGKGFYYILVDYF